MISFLNSFFKKKKSHDIVKLLNTGDLLFDVGAHIGDKSQQFLNKKLRVMKEIDSLKTIELLNSFYVSNETNRSVVLGKFLQSKNLGRRNDSISKLYRFKN